MRRTAICLAVALFLVSSPSSALEDDYLLLDTREGWQTMEMTVREGEYFSIHASGLYGFMDDPFVSSGPEGIMDPEMEVPFPGLPAYSLLATLGEEVFYVGRSFTGRAGVGGRLSFILNDPDHLDNYGFIEIEAVKGRDMGEVVRFFSDDEIIERGRDEIAFGDYLEEEFTGDEEPLSGRGPTRRYTFSGEEGRTAVIEMGSADFDCYLHLLDEEGNIIAEDDDSGGGLDSRIEFSLPKTGEYTIEATTYGESASGAYTISLSEGEAREPVEDLYISIGERIEGEFTGGEEPLSGRGPTARYIFEGGAGTAVAIGMESDELDCYLRLIGPDGAVIAENDDGGEGLNSYLEVPLPMDGEYTIEATTYSRGEAGSYTLSLMEREPFGPVDTERLGPDEPGRGILDGEDPPISGRGSTDIWRFDASAGDIILLDLVSDDFDCFLILKRNGEVVAADDDGGGDLNSSIAYEVEEPGDYEALVTSYSRGEEGEYTISLSFVDGFIEPGGSVDGYLDETDSVRSASGSAYEAWAFEGYPDLNVSIDLSSSDLDAYLVIESPGGEVVAEDDDAGGGLDARIETGLEEYGIYRIIASAYSRGEYGAYHLELSTDEEGSPVRDEAVRDEPPVGHFDAELTPVINAGSPGASFDITPYIEEGVTTIFDFYSDYCGPCRALAPRLEGLAAERDDIVVYRLDVNRGGVTGIDWSSPLVSDYGIRSLPHLVIYGPDGRIMAEGNEARGIVEEMLRGR